MVMAIHPSSENPEKSGMGWVGFEQEGGAFFLTSCIWSLSQNNLKQPLTYGL